MTEDRCAPDASVLDVEEMLQEPSSDAFLERTSPFPAEAIDRLPIGMLLVTASMAVLRSNGEAQRLLRDSNCLYLTNGHLHARSHSQQKDLRSLIARAAQTHDSEAAQGIALGRPYGIGKLVLMATPIAERILSSHCALVFVRDPDRAFSARRRLVQRLFGLSERQASLAILLTRGLTVSEAAREMQVTRNTVRTHLREVFMRLNVRKQSDVVRLMLSNALMLEWGA